MFKVKVVIKGADDAIKTFKLISGQKDGNSNINFTGGTNTVLGKAVGTTAQTSSAPTTSLNIEPVDVNGKF